jgi:hypothetical protein
MLFWNFSILDTSLIIVRLLVCPEIFWFNTSFLVNSRNWKILPVPPDTDIVNLLCRHFRWQSWCKIKNPSRTKGSSWCYWWYWWWQWWWSRNHWSWRAIWTCSHARFMSTGMKSLMYCNIIYRVFAHITHSYYRLELHLRRSPPCRLNFIICIYFTLLLFLQIKYCLSRKPFGIGLVL